MSFHKCLIQGTNIRFRPEASRKATPVMVHIEAQPYTWVRGTNTYRIYVVTEGGGKTVGFPQATLYKFLKEKGMAKEFKDFLKTKGFTNVSLTGTLAGEGFMAAAASMSLFERWTTHLAEHLPKTKAQYMMIIIYIGMGIMVGLGWGILAGKMGWL